MICFKFLKCLNVIWIVSTSFGSPLYLEKLHIIIFFLNVVIVLNTKKTKNIDAHVKTCVRLF